MADFKNGIPARPFVLVSGNRGKITEARLIAGADLPAAELDLPEIQSLDMLEILRGKAAAAWAALQRPVVVEEAGLELVALNGFPGPLVKWMLQATGAEGIARVAEALGDPRAIARCQLLYKDGDEEIVAEGVAEGTLVRPGRGSQGFGWDPVFLPAGETRTFAELDGLEKLAVSHRGRAWREMMRKLELRPSPT
ncbi:MAG TPA: non-canonical purine NTP pyrophosphatase [Thermoanaerobaculia bacterium]|jgi:XTP/dITP diphosphohydrolase|nr:non-canonical purine NTP pyrophosphatase [Thermoanaerobaculia bacterium]